MRQILEALSRCIQEAPFEQQQELLHALEQCGELLPQELAAALDEGLAEVLITRSAKAEAN